MLREGNAVLSTEHAGTALPYLHVNDTETAAKRLNEAVRAFVALKARPIQGMECLHDVIVAIHAMCGALTVAMLAGISDPTIAECVAPGQGIGGRLSVCAPPSDLAARGTPVISKPLNTSFNKR